ncbi:ImmA/IrrE family metallo-endopeptidase [Acidaminobacter hydrogenoformans]|uniref:IrrE N-terminal-like domain-containing protein n=1 Tax=Acidaminobacter hydrogenoformans DSM 2784 TaxID=1120920 RepID=A0A1G5S4L4_9FIRM|nr:ImmA/IrrE family metallo-endopeptidase [Acidaminobacter hydrogenoformans]SCZ80469.1 protein of unknown function [Acidaminobacter hydrogenoformans DSM 2784]
MKSQNTRSIQPHREPLIDRAVRSFKKDFNLFTPVVDCVEVAKRINQVPEQCNIRISSSAELSSNTLANTIYIKEHNLYYVVVNRSQLFDQNGRPKYPYKKSSDHAVNFTLAHEFGHIYLEHALIPLSEKTQEDIYEEDIEADEFAGRLLMPKKELVNANFTDLSLVAKTFMVSQSALHVRLNQLRANELKNSNRFPTCKNCGNTEFNTSDQFCPICAKSLSSHKGVLVMRYDDGIITDETGKVLLCPQCSNSDIKEEDKHCSICGIPLINWCSSSYCSVQEISDSSARHCTKCGSPTTFLLSGILEPWQRARDVQYCLQSVEEEALGSGEISFIDSQDWMDFVMLMLSDHKSIRMLMLYATARYSSGKLLILFRKNEDKFRFLSKKSYMKFFIDAFVEFFDLPLSKVNSASYEEYQPTTFIE